MTAAPTSFRLPTELRERLRASAAAEHRTCTDQVVMLLEAGLAARERTRLAAEERFMAALRDQLDAEEIAEAGAS